MKGMGSYIGRFLAGLFVLALAAWVWADITNTATGSFMDASGIPHSVFSNTVVISVSQAVTPSTPTLSLPPDVPINATITAGYNGSQDPAAYFDWTFTAVSPSQMPQGVSAHGAGVSNPAPNGVIRTPSPQASLSAVPSLGLGPYLITVTAVDNNNHVSPPAQAYVTLVAADLSGVRVYPNPWRSDKHSGLPITFDNLSVNTTIKIFTVSGHWIKTLPTSNTSVTWDLTNDWGDKVASGLYVYLITDAQGQKKTGQLAIIK